MNHHRYAGMFAELSKPSIVRLWHKYLRWRQGGVWVLHDDSGWVKAEWMNEEGGILYDNRGHGYHRTLISILAIEDYS